MRFKTRKFGGKIFKLSLEVITYREARAYANKLCNKGYYFRITDDGSLYNIWKRAKNETVV